MIFFFANVVYAFNNYVRFYMMYTQGHNSHDFVATFYIAYMSLALDIYNSSIILFIIERERAHFYMIL